MSLDSFDLPILRFLTSISGHSPLFDQCVGLLVKLDLTNGVMMTAFFWTAWFLRAESEKEQHDRRNHLLIVLAGTVIAVFLSRALQHIFHVHQRPLLAGLGIPYAPIIDPTSLNAWNSMPSDHAVLYFALATGLFCIHKRIGIVAYLWAFFIICLPRVYLGMHYPSDIAVGAVLGVAWMLMFERLPLQRITDKILDWSEAHPGIFYGTAFVVLDQIADLFDDVRQVGVTLIKYFLGHP
ncbi:MAG TPA: phosphatase PAP2 family protein [Alphaproteobacteria bacterium]|nr:phosphatase PAP2 family protein [Alphaproteobacteria bacterium]